MSETCLIDRDGQTPMHWAAFNGNIEVMQILMHHSLVEKNPNDKNGRTPFYWAAQEGHKHRWRVFQENQQNVP